MADRHRHERQDHDRQHARLDPARRRAAGHRSAGNVGTPILEAVLHPAAVRRHRRRAVQLPAALAALAVPAGLARASTSRPDHLDWHGSLEAYAADKGQRLRPTPRSRASTTCRTTATEQLVREAEVRRGLPRDRLHPRRPRAVRWSGVVDDVLADRAFVAQRRTRAAELAHPGRPAPGGGPPPAPHYVANALAAAALARAYGVAPAAPSATGCAPSVPTPHRIAEVGHRRRRHAGSTTPRPPTRTPRAASLAAFEHVVWIAGGLLKGADVDELVRGAGRTGCAGVVLIGARPRADRAGAGPTRAGGPRRRRAATDTGAMDLRRRRGGARCARPGDVVLLAPAAASMDMFTDYGARGDAFANAVRRHAAAAGRRRAMTERA